MSLTALGAVLLVCLGLLLGTTWTAQAMHHKHRQLAEERRWLDEQWLMLRQASSRCRCYQHRSEETPTQDD